MEADEEEDSEVVLKGSELYNHLLICNKEEFDIYDKNDAYFETKHSETVIRTPITKVSEELLTYLDAILNSNLLLDEDISYLYSFTVDLIRNHTSKKFWNIAWTSFLGFNWFTSAIVYNSLVDVDFLIDIYLTIKYQYDKWWRARLISNFIYTVKQLHLYFKKTSQILYEQNAYFKFHEFKSKTNGYEDEFHILEKKKKIEVDLLSNILYQCFLNNVQIIRESTKQLMQKLPLILPVDSKEHYLVFLSDVQLGLDTVMDQSNVSTQTLDRLKNIYLLMQSEFFRRLGLCFCPTLWSKKCSLKQLPFVFNIIHNYLKSCEDILCVIKYYYEKHIFPEKKVNRSKQQDSIRMGGYSAVHRISTSVTEVVIDARVLEEYVENVQHLDDRQINIISLRLEELKMALNSCIKNVIFTEKYFSKLRQLKNVKEKELDEDQDSTKDDNFMDKIGNIEIGKISQSSECKDHVYFAITEGVKETYELEEHYDIEPPQLPNFILTELKEALIQKRNEFTTRENKAIEDADEYKKFLDTPETKPEVTCRSKYQPIVENIPTCDFQVHKMLASAVAQRSAQFNNRQEEQFGTSDEESDS